MSEIVFAIYVAFVISQMGYWFLIFRRLGEPSQKDISRIQEPVSVVICAHNEADNLRRNLASILNQSYSAFEVIVVNDASTDGTKAVLEEIRTQFNHLRIVDLNEKSRAVYGKKNALIQGVLTAENDQILLTDADCFPESEYWIAEMCAVSAAKNKIVLGYSPIVQEKGILNAYQRFETIYTAIQYLGFAQAGMPYMGVGRNLSYPIKLFDPMAIRRYGSLASGDDDLLVQAVANKENTCITIDRNSFIWTNGKQSWTALFRQKKRHHSTSRYYRPKIKFLLDGYT